MIPTLLLLDPTDPAVYILAGLVGAIVLVAALILRAATAARRAASEDSKNLFAMIAHQAGSVTRTTTEGMLSRPFSQLVDMVVRSRKEIERQRLDIRELEKRVAAISEESLGTGNAIDGQTDDNIAHREPSA